MGESMVVQIVSAVAVTVVTTAMGIAAKAAVAYFKCGIESMKSQAEHVKDRLQREKMIEALDFLDDVTTRTVESLEQKVAGDLRKLVKEGKADRAGLMQLGEQAWISVIETMGPQWMEILEDNMQNIDGYIKNLIESKVLGLKKGQG